MGAWTPATPMQLGFCLLRFNVSNLTACDAPGLLHQCTPEYRRRSNPEFSRISSNPEFSRIFANPCVTRWLFWGFFCAYLAVGAYLNMLVMMLCYHAHRFSGPSRSILLIQVRLKILNPFPGPLPASSRSLASPAHPGRRKFLCLLLRDSLG